MMLLRPAQSILTKSLHDCSKSRPTDSLQQPDGHPAGMTKILTWTSIQRPLRLNSPCFGELQDPAKRLSKPHVLAPFPKPWLPIHGQLEAREEENMIKERRLAVELMAPSQQKKM
jgi:hypothetical protein